MRPEFVRLDRYFKEMSACANISRDRLAEIKKRIDSCQLMECKDEERSILIRTLYWWRKRNALFGVNRIREDNSPLDLSGHRFTEEDLKWLRTIETQKSSL